MSFETHQKQLAASIARIKAIHPAGLYDQDGTLLVEVESSISAIVEEMDAGDTLWCFVRPLPEYPQAPAIAEATTPLGTMKQTAFFAIVDGIYNEVPDDAA